MAKTPKEIELHDDAWERFERATEVVGKSPPQPRKSSDKKTKKEEKERRERTS